MRNKVPLVHPYSIMRGFTAQVSNEDEETMIELSREEHDILTGTNTVSMKDLSTKEKTTHRKKGEMDFQSEEEEVDTKEAPQESEKPETNENATNDTNEKELKGEEEEGGEEDSAGQIDALDTEEEQSKEINEVQKYQQDYEQQLRTKMRLMKKFARKRKKLEAKMTFQQRPFIDGLVLLTYDFDTKVFASHNLFLTLSILFLFT